MRTIRWFAAFAALGAVAVVGLRREQPAGEPASEQEATPAQAPYERAPAATDPSSALSRNLAGLTRAVSSLESRLERLEAAGKNGGEESESTGAVTHDEQIAAEKAYAMERLDIVEESFEAEQRDHAWAKEMEGVLQTAITDGNYGSTQILASSCKATFCRMEAVHDDAESSMKFELIKRRIPGSYYIQHIDAEEGGKPRTVAFFLRKGTERRNMIAQLMRPPE